MSNSVSLGPEPIRHMGPKGPSIPQTANAVDTCRPHRLMPCGVSPVIAAGVAWRRMIA